ncbi:MAG: hypothetical protein DBX47_02235 [Clostridiales bacterium]|nr:MAG: hypothetical protein DBX47_02235 [Clostridiales bacterium]
MKKIVSLFLVILLITGICAGFYAEPQNPFEQEDKKWLYDAKASLNSNGMTPFSLEESFDSQFIITFSENASLSLIKERLSGYEYELLARSDCRVFGIKLEDVNLFRFINNDILISCEEDKTVCLDYIPNDEYITDQWALDSLNLYSAWDATVGENEVTVAVLDTGILRNHKDFEGVKISDGYDFVSKTAYVSTDEFGHGTAVCGVIAAAQNNSKFISGAAPGITIVPYKLSKYGYLEDSVIVKAIYMAADAGCRIFNMSFGGSYDDLATRRAVEYAYSKGCVLVASAGNDGNSILNYPASYENVISVAALKKDGTRARFSQYNEFVDFIAPGEDILTLSNISDESTEVMSGTSFSSPYIAALCALVMTFNPSITPEEMYSVLKVSSSDLGEIGYDSYYGWGQPDAVKALENTEKVYVFGASDKGVYYNDVTLKFNKGTGYLNGTKVSSGVKITISGKYNFSLIDNEERCDISFTIDKRGLLFKGLESYENDSVNITFDNGEGFIDRIPYVSGAEYSVGGYHVFTYINKYGGIVSRDFYIKPKTDILKKDEFTTMISMDDEICDLALSSDENILYALSSKENCVYSYDTDTLEQMGKIIVSEGSCGMRIIEDKIYVIYKNSDCLTVVDLVTGDVENIQTGLLGAKTFAGNYIVYETQNNTCLYDTQSGRISYYAYIPDIYFAQFDGEYIYIIAKKSYAKINIVTGRVMYAKKTSEENADTSVIVKNGFLYAFGNVYNAQTGLYISTLAGDVAGLLGDGILTSTGLYNIKSGSYSTTKKYNLSAYVCDSENNIYYYSKIDRGLLCERSCEDIFVSPKINIEETTYKNPINISSEGVLYIGTSPFKSGELFAENGKFTACALKPFGAYSTVHFTMDLVSVIVNGYLFDGEIIYNIPLNTQSSDLVKSLQTTAKVSIDSPLHTGLILTLTNGMYNKKLILSFDLDVNGDGLATIADVRAAMLSVLGAEKITDAQQYAADTNKDGFVTMSDVRRMLKNVVAK